MSSVWAGLGALVGLAHLALIVVLVAGGPVALWWPAMIWIHLPALVATGAVFVRGADCPLTVWQKACIRRSGATPYEGGFVEHHLTGPLIGTKHPGLATALVVAAWVVPTVLGYALLGTRRATA